MQRIRNNIEKGTVGKREIETIDNDQKGYGAVSLIHYVHWLKKKTGSYRTHIASKQSINTLRFRAIKMMFA